jgi:hypothetical protein
MRPHVVREALVVAIEDDVEAAHTWFAGFTNDITNPGPL